MNYDKFGRINFIPMIMGKKQLKRIDAVAVQCTAEIKLNLT